MLADSISWTRALLSVGLSVLISLYGYKRKSLNLSGSLSAILVGVLLTSSNGCFFLTLLTFFITSSRLTKWKAAEKKKLECDHKEGGQRNWIQVFCNGSVACVAAVAYVWLAGGYGETSFSLSSPVPSHTLAAAACLASISCCCGDTWASEVGSVKGGTPRLITTLKKVPPGTNGGVTFVGLLCSFLGGMFVGVAYFVGLFVFVEFASASDALEQAAIVVAIGGASGLLGSVIDSLLGATVQYSGFSSKLHCVVHAPSEDRTGEVRHISGHNWLDNDSVNFTASLVMALITPVTLYLVWFDVFASMNTVKTIIFTALAVWADLAYHRDCNIASTA